MSGDESDRRDETVSDTGRRRLLKRAGVVLGTPFVLGSEAYRADRSYTDEDGDGIPDSLERSTSLHRDLVSIFGSDQFSGLDPKRKDLLIDARYIGQATISDHTKRRIESLFRANGIYLQWLEYPDRYDVERFEDEYGYHVKDILWSPRSFYYQRIEDVLTDIALQLIVVPGHSEPQVSRRLDSLWTHLRNDTESFAGMSFGNRAVVTEQEFERPELRLVLHEVAHLALCHDDDPNNTGVMGLKGVTTDVDLMDWEWASLRDNLDAIRDTTGIDVASRRCIWDEALADSIDERL